MLLISVRLIIFIFPLGINLSLYDLDFFMGDNGGCGEIILNVNVCRVFSG